VPLSAILHTNELRILNIYKVMITLGIIDKFHKDLSKHPVGQKIHH
jgi:hypothetical protein